MFIVFRERLGILKIFLFLFQEIKGEMIKVEVQGEIFQLLKKSGQKLNRSDVIKVIEEVKVDETAMKCF